MVTALQICAGLVVSATLLSAATILALFELGRRDGCVESGGFDGCEEECGWVYEYCADNCAEPGGDLDV